MPRPRPATSPAATTRFRTHVTAVERAAAASRRRARRIPQLLTAATLLLLWGIYALGWYFAALLVLLSTAAAAVILGRRRPDVAASITTAVLTSAAPAALIVVGADHGRPLADVMPLLIFAFAGALPTMVAWMCRPVISRPINALIGSLVLLIGAAVQWFLGAAGGWVMYAALLTSITIVALRYQRALRRRLGTFTTVDGWTDVGRRTLNAGATQQLLIGHGRAIPVFAHDRPTPAELQGFVYAAAALANHLMLPPARVQPVVLQRRPGTDWRRTMVNDGDAASSVPIGAADALPAIRAAFAADSRTHHGAAAARLLQRWLDRRLVRRAAATPAAI